MKKQKLLTVLLNRILRLSLPLAFLLVFLVSCDPVVDYSRVVQNNSDYDVKVLKGFGSWYLDGNDTIYTQIDTITINKGTSAVIFNYVDMGTVAQFLSCSRFDEPMLFLVSFSDSIKEISNIQIMSNWRFRVIKEYKIGGGGVCECRLYLTNEMLEDIYIW